MDILGAAVASQIARSCTSDGSCEFAMKFRLSVSSEERVGIAATSKTERRRLLWSVIVLTSITIATLLWTGTLFWLVWRMLFLIFFD
jgi:hypothetical protein